MAKCFALCFFVFVCLCRDAFGSLSEDMAVTTQRCCKDGTALARNSTSDVCSSSLPTPTDILPSFVSICSMARQQCCMEYFEKKKLCDTGIDIATSMNTCDFLVDSGKSCCNQCRKGSTAGRLKGEEYCSRRRRGTSPEELLSDDAYTQCCKIAAKDYDGTGNKSFPPTIDRPVSKKRTETTIPSVCEDYAPNELCAHHCIPIPGSYKCECNAGFKLMADGRNCIEVVKNRCRPRNPCQHKCNDNGIDVKCSCRRGYQLMSDGKSCQDIDECSLDLPVCLAGTQCQNSQGSYKCIPIKTDRSSNRGPTQPTEKGVCPPGFTWNGLNNACDDINECLLTNPPCPSYLCENTVGGYKCGGVAGDPGGLGSASPAPVEDRCPPGFKLGFSGQCEDVDECAIKEDDCNSLSQLCINTHSSFYCQDRVSRHCPPGFKINDVTNKCEDIDECEENSDICRADQVCINQLGQYDCKLKIDESSHNQQCPEGFRMKVEGNGCEDIDECLDATHVCKGHQTCLNTNGSYDCHCMLGYELDAATADDCVDINECATGQNDCMVDSQRCDNTIGSYLCIRITPCGTGYILHHSSGNCEDIDECALGTHNCARAGPEYHCVNIAGSFRCVKKRSSTTTTTLSPEYDDYEYYDSEEVEGNQTNSQNTEKTKSNTTNESTTITSPNTELYEVPTTLNPPTSEKSYEQSSDKPKRVEETYEQSSEKQSSKPEELSPNLSEQLPTEKYPIKPEVHFSRPENLPPKPNEPIPTLEESLPRPIIEQAEPEITRLDDNAIDVGYPNNVYYEASSEPTQQEPLKPVDEPKPKSKDEKPLVKDSRRPEENEVTSEEANTNEINRNEHRNEETTYTPSPQPDEIEPTPPQVINIVVGQNTATISGERRSDGSVVVDVKKIPENKWTKINVPSNCPRGFKIDEYGSCFDIDECATNHHSCSNVTESCRNTIGGYLCDCASGYRRNPFTATCTLTTTSSTTTSSPIYIYGPLPGKGSFWGYPDYKAFTSRPFRPRSMCDVGYHFNSTTGICEDMNECTNGLAKCGTVEICVNTEGGYRCECPPNWRLDDVRHRCMPVRDKGQFPTGYGNEPSRNSLDHKDEVIPTPATKVTDSDTNRIDNEEIELKCPRGYVMGTDNICEDVDECATGEAKCGFIQICSNKEGGYVCSCPPGHKQVNDHECEDVDECALAGNMPICSQNANCINTVGSYSCRCHEGFRPAPINDKVCVDVDECVESRPGLLCDHRCNNVWGGYRCSCHRGYRLNLDNKTCSDVDECVAFKSKFPCVGRCLNEPGSYRCSCPTGYKLSEDKRSCTDINECETGEAVCATDDNISYGRISNVCFNTRGSYRCQKIVCPQGYQLEGKHRCTKTQRVCEPGDWNCAHQPTTISYNFITFVSNLFIPKSEVKLFTMRGPAWPYARMKFELHLKDVNVPPSVKNKADSSYFTLKQNGNEAVMSLARPLEGPQSIELELSMELFNRDQFGGMAVAKLFIFVSEYEF